MEIFSIYIVRYHGKSFHLLTLLNPIVKRMKKFYKIISNKLTIFSVFLSLYLFGIIWLLFTGEADALDYMSTEKLLLLRLASFLTYLTLAYLSYKGIKIFTWLMAAILLFSGIGATFAGIFKIEWHQYVMKSHLLIFGIYFIFGSVVLIRDPVMRKERV